LPDPKDGSLYLLNPGEAGILKKLPFSIQQLVASSPCKSSDGIFYTGKKIDSWLSIDWKTGKKTSVLSFDALQKTCPLSSSNSLFIGRTGLSGVSFASFIIAFIYQTQK
jgi:serine/threonine-protein kinase/endoribonuclease IRE1